MTAIATQHVVILSDDEINVAIAALREQPLNAAAGHLADRLQFGDDLGSILDERIAREDRKRILTRALRANDARIRELNDQLDEQWRERGITSERHAATGKLVHRTRGRVFAKVRRAGDTVTPEERQAACDALKSHPTTADFVREDFSTSALGAHIKELADAYDEQQRQLPPDQRQPRDINDFLPEAARPFVEVTDNPTISVRS